MRLLCCCPWGTQPCGFFGPSHYGNLQIWEMGIVSSRGAMGRIGSFWVEKGRCGHCGHPGPSLSSPGKRCIIWPCRRNIKIMFFFGRRWGGCITTRLQKANRTGQAKAGRQSQLRPGPQSTHLFGPKPVWYSRSAFVRTRILIKELCPRLSF